MGSIAKCDDDTELTCCARWTPILFLVMGYCTALCMCYLIIKAYTASAEAQDLLKAMFAPCFLTGLCFAFLAGLIAIMHLARRQTGTEKLRFIRYAGFVAIALLIVRFVDMITRDFTNIPHPLAAKLPPGMVQPTSLPGMQWQAQLTAVTIRWKVGSYCTL